MSNNTFNIFSRNPNPSDDEHRASDQKSKHFPRRIILVRHGESEVNEDEGVLEYVPNYKIKLIKKGIHQAQETGRRLKEIVSEDGECEKWKVFFYVSPSSRTRETTEEIIGRGGTFEKDRIVGVREECRLREQHFGNFQDVEERRKIKSSRNRYGKFFYRIPDGESSADVYDRVSSKFTFYFFMLHNSTIHFFYSMIQNFLFLTIFSKKLTIIIFFFQLLLKGYGGTWNPINLAMK